MQLQPGTTLQNGKYRIEKVLGQGGFGITYLAVHTSLKSKVCIKEFFPQTLCNRDNSGLVTTISDSRLYDMEIFKRRFLDEARKVFNMHHDNIVAVSDLFEENATAYYVMEYIEGETLHTKINHSGALSEKDAIRYTSQIAQALSYIHSRNTLHLDIKPANIIIRASDDSAVVIDFGLARHYDSKNGEQTTTHLSALSPGYAPFEQSLTEGLSLFSPASDIYSLGATLYTMVMGTRPPEAARIPSEGLPKLPSNISSAVKSAITNAMEYSIKKRPQNIAEFMTILNSTEHEASKQKKWFKLLVVICLCIIVCVIGLLTLGNIINTESEYKQNIKSHTTTQVTTNSDSSTTEMSELYEIVEPDEPEIDESPSDLALKDTPSNYTETSHGIHLNMVWIEGGSFYMGSDHKADNAQPIHNVSLDGYWIAQTEITQAQWEAVMGTTIEEQRIKAKYSKLYGEGNNYPMYFVNYNEALEFCRRLSNATGKNYTLPTEAQWEYAARGGGSSPDYIYSGSNDLNDVAWHKHNSDNLNHPICNLAPNELGLYDMSGNVWEWCKDWLGNYNSGYSHEPTGPNNGTYRVVRGGSWLHEPDYCRTTCRIHCDPGSRHNRGGFRIVCIPD